MHTINVKTATSESAEQFKTDKFQRYCVTDENDRLSFINTIFMIPSSVYMINSWLHQHSDYDGGFWNYWMIPQGIGGNVSPNTIFFTTKETGYIAPEGEQKYIITIPEFCFVDEVSADAAGIIVTLTIMNMIRGQAEDMGPEYEKVVDNLKARAEALKRYITIIQHPEGDLISLATV